MGRFYRGRRAGLMVSVGSAGVLALTVAQATGQACFKAPVQIDSEPSVPLVAAEPLSKGDINGDGVEDLIRGDTATLRWLDPTNAYAPTTIAFATRAFINPIDLDGDSDIDVVCTSGGTTIYWYENTGAGLTWVEHTITTTGLNQGLTFQVADLDGDSDADFLLADSQTTVWHEHDALTHEFTQRLVGASGTRHASVADLDGDLDLDVVICDTLPGVRWWRNEGGSPPTFSGPHSASSAPLVLRLPILTWTVMSTSSPEIFPRA